MAERFPQTVIDQAWERSKGRCECTRTSCGHRGRCNTKLNKGSRGLDSPMGWGAHYINSNGAATLSNFEILCQDCHNNTRSYGRAK